MAGEEQYGSSERGGEAMGGEAQGSRRAKGGVAKQKRRYACAVVVAGKTDQPATVGQPGQAGGCKGVWVHF